DSLPLTILCTIHHHVFLLFFHDPPPTDLYTLSLHDALPIYGLEIPVRRLRHLERALQERELQSFAPAGVEKPALAGDAPPHLCEDRKSTRLNSSHLVISYAVFCLKKKKNNISRHLTHHSNIT